MKPKRCSSCRLTKAAYCFYLATGGTSLQSRCRDCHRDEAREWARRNRARIGEVDRVRKRERYWSDPGYRRKQITTSTVNKRRARDARLEEAA